MAFQIKAGVATLIMFWLAIVAGAAVGAQVGFTVEDQQNATVEFDAETGDFQVGNQTSNIYEPPDEETKQEMEESRSEWVKETEANIQAALPELEDPPQLAPAWLDDRMDQYTQEFVNGSMEQMFHITADIGGPVASFTYENRDWLDEDLVMLTIAAVAYAPFVAVIYAFIRRVRR